MDLLPLGEEVGFDSSLCGGMVILLEGGGMSKGGCSSKGRWICSFGRGAI